MPSTSQVLQVARAHGTLTAAEWGGVHRMTVLEWRKKHDGYRRGRGHPTKAEKEAAKLRPGHCLCPACEETWLSSTVVRGWMAARRAPGRGWKALAACRLVHPDVFFPKHPNMQYPPRNWMKRYEPAKAICGSCPVQTECLRYSLKLELEDGVFGGLSPIERKQLLRWWKRARQGHALPGEEESPVGGQDLPDSSPVRLEPCDDLHFAET